MLQLKFNVLEFPAVTVCNQNQFRKDRAPDDLDSLLGEFLNAKRADMFGGKDRLNQFENSMLMQVLWVVKDTLIISVLRLLALGPALAG